MREDNVRNRFRVGLLLIHQHLRTRGIQALLFVNAWELQAKKSSDHPLFSLDPVRCTHWSLWDPMACAGIDVTCFVRMRGDQIKSEDPRPDIGFSHHVHMECFEPTDIRGTGSHGLHRV